MSSQQHLDTSAAEKEVLSCRVWGHRGALGGHVPFAGTLTPSARQVFRTCRMCSGDGAYVAAAPRVGSPTDGCPARGCFAGCPSGDFACWNITTVGQQRGWGRA